MNRYKKALLNNLESVDIYGDEEPLKNIKNEMGSLRQIVGNPLFKAEISIQVNTYFYNVAGVPILPIALPIAQQTSLPVWLLGLTDLFSGYIREENINPVNNGWFRVLGVLSSGIVGYTMFMGAAAIPPLNYGDIVLSFVDTPPPAAANFQAFVVIHCNNVGYGTFLNSFVSDLIVCNQIRMIVPAANIIQLTNPLIFGYQSLFGKLATDSIDPRMYQTPDEFQNQIADIPVTFPIDKNLMLAFQLNVFCQQVSFVFFVNKVEPLTLRPKIIR